jgi:hypothetical protein
MDLEHTVYAWIMTPYGTMSTRNSHYTDQAPDYHSDKTQRIYMDML